MVTSQFAFKVDGQELLLRQHLRASTLEVVIDEFHAVYLAIVKLGTQLHCDVNAWLHLRMVNQ